jgi:hypothetical protein
MIPIEKRIGEIVDILPTHTEPKQPTGFTVWPVRFDWGTMEVLTKFLVLKENQSKYPLIWLINEPLVDITYEDKPQNMATRKARFILATRSTNPDGFNKFQWDNDFSKVLVPVYDNFIKGLTRSGNFAFTSDLRGVGKAPNLSVKNNGKGLITIWNAITFTIDLRLDNRKCLNKNIKF